MAKDTSDAVNRHLSRRTLLRGASVALALPWLESLLPRNVRAQDAALPRRFMPVYLPNGAAEFWRPETVGSGDAWQLSSILEPFGTSLKSKLSVVTGFENGSVFSADPIDQVEPSHSRLSGAWLTCVDAANARVELNLGEANGVSVDQLLAQHSTFKDQTPLASLQLGLSTALSSCETEPCSSSRSVSWATGTQPLYKRVDPLEVFNQLANLGQPVDPNGPAALESQKRLARNQSVLDAVLENAERTRTKLGVSDQRRMDEFLESVRAVERRVTGVSLGMGGLACGPLEAPTLGAVEQSELAPRQTTANYDKGLHADAMNDLIAMAFQCDVTRVITYMLEDERSEFTYDHVEERAFTAQGSTAKGGPCPEYHAAQHHTGDDFSTITWWNVGKVAELCRRLDAIEEVPGVSVLDNCVVLFGGCMHGGNHSPNELPVALIGGRNLGLKNDQHVVLDKRPLRDLYVTLMNQVFGLGLETFGQNLTGAPPSTVDQLLET